MKFALRFLGITALALLVLSFIVPPLLLPGVISRQLVALGVERVDAGSVWLNPLAGRANLRDWRLFRGDEPVLELGYVEVDLSLLALLGRNIRVESAKINGVSIEVHMDENGQLQVAGLPIPTEEQTASETSAPAHAPSLQLDNLHIDKLTVQIDTPQLQQDLRVESLRLGNLGLPSTEQAKLELEMAMSSLAVELEAELKQWPQAPQLVGEAELRIEDLEALAAELPIPDDLKLAGQTDIQIEFDAQQDATAVAVDFDIKGNASGVKIDSGGQGIDETSLTWNVDGRFEQDQDSLAVILQSADIPQLQALLQIDSTPVEASTEDSALEPDQDPKAEDTESDDKPGSGLALAIQRFSVGEGARIRLRDKGASNAAGEPFELDMRIDTLLLEDLDNRQTDNRANFDLAFGLQEHGQLRSKGTVAAFAAPLQLQLEGALQQIELTDLSPYTEREVGYHVRSGQMTATFSAELVEQEIKVENEVDLLKLKLEPADEAMIAKFQKELTMPLDAALSILRDDNNNIHLSIPVSGAVDDPDIDFGQLLNTAVGKAATAASISYVKHLLQPYGTLITLSQYAGKELTKIRLDPVLHVPGSAQLEPESLAYLDKIAELMGRKQELGILLCGIATEADRSVLGPAVEDKALLALAEKRSNSLKQSLMDRYQLSADRLFFCKAEIDTDQNAKPRTRLEI